MVKWTKISIDLKKFSPAPCYLDQCCTLSLQRHFNIYLLLHRFGVHVRDKADGELANDLAGDDSLGPCLGESSLNTMK